MAYPHQYNQYVEEMLEQLERSFDQYEGFDPHPNQGTATLSSMLSFAQCTDPWNPLFNDPEYAKNTKWGSLIAFPNYADTIGTITLQPQIDPRAGFAVNAFPGENWKFYKPIRPGDTFRVFRRRGRYEDITRPDGSPFQGDTRRVLRQAVRLAEEQGCAFRIGSEIEFYLFRQDENGEPTKLPYDTAGYMDIAPADKGENVRREICLTLERMGILPEASHHESGPGQNEIDFRHADPLAAADNAVTFQAVVRTIAAQYGLWADFSPRPLADKDGSGMHINVSAARGEAPDPLPQLIAGILRRAREITLFLNPVENSYERLGRDKAPRFVTWSPENRSQLIRIPAAEGEFRRMELRSPDPAANPYLAFALVMYAGLEGIREQLPPPAPGQSVAELPRTLREAAAAADSEFIRRCLPELIVSAYRDRRA